MNNVKFTGISAALLAVASQVPQGFEAFSLTGSEYQVLLVAAAAINAVIMQFITGDK